MHHSDCMFLDRGKMNVIKFSFINAAGRPEIGGPFPKEMGSLRQDEHGIVFVNAHNQNISMVAWGRIIEVWYR